MINVLSRDRISSRKMTLTKLKSTCYFCLFFPFNNLSLFVNRVDSLVVLISTAIENTGKRVLPLAVACCLSFQFHFQVEFFCYHAIFT